VSRLDSVEVKVTLGKEHVRAALSAFGLTAEEGQERLIYFREDVTPQTSAGTPLLDAHVILRARTWSGDEGDTTVKLRPARQTQLSARVPVQEVEYGDVKEELKGRSSSTRCPCSGRCVPSAGLGADRTRRCRPVAAGRALDAGPAGLPRAVDRDQAADARAGQKKLTELVRSRVHTGAEATTQDHARPEETRRAVPRAAAIGVNRCGRSLVGRCVTGKRIVRLRG
jgi:hypothetical protein